MDDEHFSADGADLGMVGRDGWGSRDAAGTRDGSDGWGRMGGVGWVGLATNRGMV